jgi:hypothetical protein
MSNNPTNCNIKVLGEVASLATNPTSPSVPYPMFFKEPDCGGIVAGVGSSQTFPTASDEISCPNLGTYPTYKNTQGTFNNCLAVISLERWESYRTSSQFLDKSEVNILNTDKNHPKSNIFPEDVFISSWYVPPGYKVVFLEKNPSEYSYNEVYSSVYLEMGENFLEVDNCVSKNYLRGKDPSTRKILATCSDGTAHKSSIPYAVVIKTEQFTDIVLDMCIYKRGVVVGDTNLNTIWNPASDACDGFITTFCKSSAWKTHPKGEDICACFNQQRDLDNIYGEKAGVSVCCFGRDTSGRTEKSCSFNRGAYKTKNMLENCCSFAQCQTSINTRNTAEGDKTYTIEGVTCEGNFVDFPQRKEDKLTGSVPDSQISSETGGDVGSYAKIIPTWVWSIYGAGLIFIVLFLIGLAFIN